MNRKVYADNAATTAVSPQVLEAMLPFYKEVYGNPSSLYALGQEAKRPLEEARATVARCLGAEPTRQAEISYAVFCLKKKNTTVVL